MSIEAQTNLLPLLNFSGGFNSDASPVTMKNTDLDDVLNVDVLVNGGVRRRRSYDFIGELETSEYTTLLDETYYTDGVFTKAPITTYKLTCYSDTNEELTFVVVHVGYEIRFYLFDDILNLLDLANPYQTIDMSVTYSSYIDTDFKYYRSTYKVDRNKLFILNQKLTPGYFYLNSSDEFEFSPITVYYRDIDGGVSSFVNNDNVSYACINAHTSSATDEPGTGTDWKVYWYTFGPYADTDTNDWASGTSYVTNVTSATGYFSTMCFACGRIWYAGNTAYPSTIFFSQSISDDLDYGFCFTAADPLNQYDSAVVDSDGGTIEINGMETVIAITEYRTGVIVFASNGIWHLHGGSSFDSTFLATDFAVDKVSDVSIVGRDAFVKTDDNMVLFCYGGIFTFDTDYTYSKISIKRVSANIDSFYRNIPIANRSAGKAVYNTTLRKIYFFTNFEGNRWIADWNQYEQSGSWRDVIVLDLVHGGWWKYSLATDDTGYSISISDAIAIPASDAVDSMLVDEDNDFLIDSSDNSLISFKSTEGTEEFLNLCVVTKRVSNSIYWAFALSDQETSLDWSLSEDDASSYTSYIETAQINANDVIHNKQITHVAFIFERTESGVLNSSDEDITASGCLFTPIYNWATSSRNSSYGKTRQVYRPNKWNISRYDGASVAKEVVTTKEKVNGRGKSFKVRLENDGTKLFVLYGAELVTSASART